MANNKIKPETRKALIEIGLCEEENFGMVLTVPNFIEDLEESSFNYGIIDNKHKNQSDVAYRIYIRDKNTSAYEGKLSAHWFSIKVYKDGTSSKNGEPARVKMSAYYVNGKRDNDDKDFDDELKNIQKKTKLKRFVKNFIFDNQDLLIRYYLSTDTDEQQCIQDELQYKIDHKEYHTHTIDPMSQEKLDYLLSEEGKQKYVCLHQKNTIK